jgi:hypothetical protein
VTNNLFTTPPKIDAPPPTNEASGSDFLVLQPRCHELTFPTYDSKDKLLQWLNRCEQFFRGKWISENKKMWYMRLAQDKVIYDGGNFACGVNEYFGPPTRRNPLSKLAVLCKIGPLMTTLSASSHTWHVRDPSASL